MNITVFLGPSLARPEAEALLEADYLPPVRQGDIYRLVNGQRPRAIAVIDGYFQEVPSVWHKEILWALDRGIPVYGAASMGALRAAELQRYGMIGVGKIYEAYLAGTYEPYDHEPFEDDDEVAVIHGPAELGFPALSDAMVDLREALAAAARAGVIDGRQRDALVAAFKRRFYRERSFDVLPQVLTELKAPAPVAEALLAWLPEGRRSQKGADARALLLSLTGESAERPVAREPFVFERTTLWVQFVEQAEGLGESVSEAESLVLDELRLDPAVYDGLWRMAALRLHLKAVDPLPTPGDDARRAALDRLRRRHGLLSRAALEAWAEACDLDQAGLNRLLDYEATLEASLPRAGQELDAALLDILRSEGSYATLAARARDKQACLENAGKPASAPSALSSRVLQDWYFESRLAQGVPADIERYAADLGFVDRDGFLAAVARERAYLALRHTAREEEQL